MRSDPAISSGPFERHLAWARSESDDRSGLVEFGFSDLFIIRIGQASGADVAPSHAGFRDRAGNASSEALLVYAEEPIAAPPPLAEAAPDVEAAPAPEPEVAASEEGEAGGEAAPAEGGEGAEAAPAEGDAAAEVRLRRTH